MNQSQPRIAHWQLGPGLLLSGALLLALAACGTAQPTAPSATATVPPPPTDTPLPTPTPTPTPTPIPTPPPLPYYDLNVSYDHDAHRAEVAEHLVLFNDGSDTWSQVVFSVPPAYWPDVWTLNAVQAAWGTERLSVTPLQSGTVLTVPLPAPAPPGQAVEVLLAFTLQLPPLDPAAWPPLSNMGWGPQVTQFGEWYAAVVPYRDGQGWLSWPYHPVGDPTVNEIATYNVHVAAAEGLIVAAPGLVGEQAGNWHFQLARARSFAFHVSPDYQFVEQIVDGVPIRSYYLRGSEWAGQAVLTTTVQAFGLFSERYGSFPYPELIVAQNGRYGGMEYSAFVSQSSYAYQTYSTDPRDLLVSLTAHEVAHQWWYGAVGNDQVHQPWLDEGLATYSEALFYETYYPDIVPWWWDTHVDRWNPVYYLDSTIYEFADTPTYLHQVYGQGARFIRDLRMAMGDEAFFAFLQDYRATYDGQLAGSADLVATARAHTTVDLSPLVQQYFEHPDF